MPEVKIVNIEKIKLEKPKLKVKNIDLEKAVEKIADQYKEWNLVEKKIKERRSS